MADGEPNIAVLSGKTALVTGGSRGLGLAVAERFLADGAHVAICAREQPALKEAAAALRQVAPTDQRVTAEVADVSRPGDIERLMKAIGGVDIAVCNAGIHGPIGPFEESDWNQWAAAVQVNLLGTALVCRTVIPHMRLRGWGKIVALSGGGATIPRPRFSAYAASKAAVVRFAETLAVELKGSGIDVNAVAPGALNTRLLDHMLEAGPDRMGAEQYQRAVRQRDSGGQSFETAVDLISFLVSPASDGISGRVIAAVWDDWRRLPDIRERLMNSDVYTLRRILPDDRGWSSS
jgi:NAD(P)-dependent dehydrogenase (short-subunit alcohol dehydrogenase family)